MPGPQWEFTHVLIGSLGSRQRGNLHAGAHTELQLNKLGEQGWQVAGMNETFVVLQRRVTEEPNVTGYLRGLTGSFSLQVDAPDPPPPFPGDPTLPGP